MKQLINYVIGLIWRVALVCVMLALFVMGVFMLKAAGISAPEQTAPVHLVAPAKASEHKQPARAFEWRTPRGKSAAEIERGRKAWETDPRGPEALRYERPADKAVCDRYRERAAGRWGVVAVGAEVRCDR